MTLHKDDTPSPAPSSEVLEEIKYLALTAGAPGHIPVPKALARMVGLCNRAGVTKKLDDLRPLFAADAKASQSFQEAFPGSDGIGASYHRETDSWRLYTMTPDGAKGFGSIDGYDTTRIDWIIDALRAGYAKPSPQTSNGPTYLDFITPDEIFDKGPAAVKHWKEAKRAEIERATPQTRAATDE